MEDEVLTIYDETRTDLGNKAEEKFKHGPGPAVMDPTINDSVIEGADKDSGLMNSASTVSGVVINTK
jgi:hypothetical protein